MRFFSKEVSHLKTIFRVKQLRKSIGLTQAQLAKQLGFKSSSAVAMWETGDRNPPSILLPRLAEVLHCHIDELFDQTAYSDFKGKLDTQVDMYQNST